jgi:hypothetical protein
MTDEESILKAIGAQLKSAVNWSNSAIAQKREKALKYYNREPLPGDENPKVRGKSKYVDPRIQQSVDWLGSQLLKIFDSPENVVEFSGFGPEDEAQARDQTRICNWLMKTQNRHEVYMTQWIQDGLILGMGVVTAELEVRVEESLPRILKNVPNETLVALNEQEEAGKIVIEEVGKAQTQPGPMGIIETRDLKIRTITRKPRFNILSVAAEDFVVSQDARFCNETGGVDAAVQGHRKYMSRSDLIELGYDKDKVDALPKANDKTDGLALMRSADLAGEQGIGPDDVDVYTIYTKMRVGSDNKARHWRITIGGDLENKPVILDFSETSRYYPYCIFVPHQISNSIMGKGVADRLNDEHIYQSRIARAMLDNTQAIVNPTRLVRTDGVSMDDLLNPSPDAIVRVDALDAITYVSPPFIAQNLAMVADRISQSTEYSTGVGPSMMALDASDLQRTSATASTIRSNNQQLLIEGISRWFAGTGYAYLVRLSIDMMRNNPDDAQELLARLFARQDTQLEDFDPDFDMKASVAFNQISRDQSIGNLTNLLQLQFQAMDKGLPIVNPQQIYSTYARIVEATGSKNISMFVTDPSTLPEQPTPQPLPDPNAGIIQVETVKAQLKAQSDEADRQFQIAKLTVEMDLKRDIAAQNFELKRAEITAKYSAQVEVERLKIEQSMPRDPMSGNWIGAQQPQSQYQPEQQPQPQPVEQPQPEQPMLMPSDPMENYQ